MPAITNSFATASGKLANPNPEDAMPPSALKLLHNKVLRDCTLFLCSQSLMRIPAPECAPCVSKVKLTNSDTSICWTPCATDELQYQPLRTVARGIFSI